MASGEKKLRLYNTLTREKADFVPLDPGNVRMYVCGPTVYDYAHIGNARPVIVFDVLFRLLRHLYGEAHVTYVRNITDVDDKINARALRDFGEDIAAGRMSLNEAIRRVTETTAAQFHADVKALGCLEPTVEPRATDFVLPRTDGKADMVSLIQTLLDSQCAYVATGGEGREVLFDTASMPDYGKLSGRRLEDQQAGARIAPEAHKKSPSDFVLWKESAETEPGWNAEFAAGGNRVRIFGRPGWHIECSAMSEAYLGTQFDIHGGGLDLIFPHHENELAQSRCAHGTPMMAQVWMHNGFLQVEGQKMSKSLGNFVTIHELLATEKFGGRKWPGQVLRLAMLMTHYREPIDFTVSRLEEAEITLSYCATFAAPESAGKPSAELLAALEDDLNTPRAMAEINRLWRAARAGAHHIAARAAQPGIAMIDPEATSPGAELAASLALLGIDIANYDRDWRQNQMVSKRDVSGVEQAITDRLAALSAKDFATADRIRAELLEQGIQLMDSKNAAGERITTWEVKR